MDDALDGVGLGSPLPLMQIVLPIGISFFTFQAISYVVDVYRRETRPPPSATWRSSRASSPTSWPGRSSAPTSCSRSSARPRDPRARAGRAGAASDRRRADQEDGGGRRAGQARSWTRCSTIPRPTPGWRRLLAIYGFAAQIYCDFSGYTDMAIGLALLLGFRPAPELRPPVPGHEPRRVLAPLAHDAVALAARLPLHPARREPRRAPPHLPQPHASRCCSAGSGTARRGRS